MVWPAARHDSCTCGQEVTALCLSGVDGTLTIPPLKDANISPRLSSITFISILRPALFPSASPALFTLQQTPVGGDLSLQFHLGVQKLAVALTLSGQSRPHLLQLSLQAADHLGEVLQAAGVQLLRVLQGGLQAFLLNSEEVCGNKAPPCAE